VVGAQHVDQRAQGAAQPGRERPFGVEDWPAGRRVLGAGLGFPYFEEPAFDADLAIEMS